MPFVVTIDGPAGAGKSTVARRLAERLGWRFLDTGAMYRVVTLAAMCAGVDLGCEAALANLVEKLAVSLHPGRVLLGEEDVTESIRANEVTRSSRFIADSPSVRRRLMIWQRAFADLQHVVTEGRDQGTLVFPEAFRKYYLTASDDERARRRVAESLARGEAVSFDSMLADQRDRDARDAARAIAPMKPASDATVIDSTGLSIDEVVDRLARDIERTVQSQVPGPIGRAAGRAAAGSTSRLDGTSDPGRKGISARAPLRDRPAATLLWYRFAQFGCAILGEVVWRWRATGQRNVPESGGVLLVCNHVSFLDVFFLAFPLRRPLNYVARSTLFVPVLGPFIRSVGGFPIQREGLGAAGMKETLRRLRAGGIVALFPEGTRSHDGQLGSLKPGIAALASRVGVPVVPAALAGMFEIWPRSHVLPVPNPVRIHFGPPIQPQELAGLDTESATALIRARMRECHAEACRALHGDLAY